MLFVAVLGCIKIWLFFSNSSEGGTIRKHACMLNGELNLYYSHFKFPYINSKSELYLKPSSEIITCSEKLITLTFKYKTVKKTAK